MNYYFKCFIRDPFREAQEIIKLKIFVNLNKISKVKLENTIFGGTWMAQFIKRLTLDLSSGHHLEVVGAAGYARGMQPAWDSLSLLHPPPKTHF